MLQFDEKKIQTREQPMLARLRELNRQTSGKKTDLFEGKILLSFFSIWRKIIIRHLRKIFIDLHKIANYHRVISVRGTTAVDTDEAFKKLNSKS